MTDGPPAPAPDGAVPPAATATTGGNVSAAVALAAAAGSSAAVPAPKPPPTGAEMAQPPPKPAAAAPVALAATEPAGGSDDLHPPAFAVASSSSAPSASSLALAATAAAPSSSSGLPLVDFRQKRGQVSVAPSPPKPSAKPSAVPSSSSAASAAVGVGGTAAMAGEKPKKKAAKPKKKRGSVGSVEGSGGGASGMGETKRKPKKKKEKSSKDKPASGAPAKSGAKKKKSSSSTSGQIPQRPGAAAASSSAAAHPPGYSAQQAAVHDMMRRALEEDQYSALGSVVDTDSSDDDGEGEEGEGGQVRWNHRPQRGGAGGVNEEEAGGAWMGTVKLDRASLHAAMRRHLRLEGAKAVRNFDAAAFVDDATNRGAPSAKRVRRLSPPRDDILPPGKEVDVNGRRIGKRRKKKKGKSHQRGSGGDISEVSSGAETPMASGTEEAWEGEPLEGGGGETEEAEYGGRDGEAPEEGGSIFGQTAGASNATWVECDRCKKWRRLRGVVDARKLPSRWYCSMNKTDPDRARCSAPEEEYDAATTPESAADHRARRHLRVWVRRLHCNEAYENRQRGNKKRASASMASGTNNGGAGAATEPYEWVRCCNPSCGKWRMLLRSMDAASVMDGCADGEWYCVMNTWDEKAASCGAAQEHLPAVGCPPWVMVDAK